ncbi:Kae1-associated serine/threonine protein kinase [Candidatus Pacearchaeota archaeon]|nr:Kae1-associated serine/threonine protein kinase [Candidatus Pacearchaeota archaeon]
MTSQILCQGAEAIIIKSNNFVIKDRIPKSYRLKELDEKIRSRRTRSEAKLLLKASSLIDCPSPFFQPSIKGSKKIKMPFIDGKKLSKNLNSFSLDKQKQICRQIGESVAKLHDKDIIHGDLTTSNMILVEAHTKTPNLKKISSLIKSPTKKPGEADFGATNRASAPIIFFIDFGLGFISHKFEDKAVDLHLLKQALETKHFKNWEALFNEFLKGYCKPSNGRVGGNAKTVLERLKAVEKRGRYKH